MGSKLSKILSARALPHHWREKRKNFIDTCTGVDGNSFDVIERDSGSFFRSISRAIADESYPDGLLAIPIPKGSSGKYRIICVPTIRDRFIQQVILDEVYPSIMKSSLNNQISYGVLKGVNGLESARARACQLRNNHPWVYKTDIQSFFDEINRDVAISFLGRFVKTKSLSVALGRFMSSEITRGVGADWKQIVSISSIKRGLGIRQGMPISSLISAILLSDFDKSLAKRGLRAIRYVDDIAVFCSSQSECETADEFVRSQLEKLKLRIGAMNAQGSKTAVFGPDQCAEFLGMEITPVKNGRCNLLVPEQKILHVIETIDKICDLEYLNREGITIGKFESYLENYARGVKNSYRFAHNFNSFSRSVDLQCDIGKNRLLGNLFGNAFLSRLSPGRRSFLGLK